VLHLEVVDRRRTTNSLFSCNIFIQDLQLGGISAVYHDCAQSGLSVHRGTKGCMRDTIRCDMA